MIRRRVSIACIQETKWTGEKARKIEDIGFKLYYSSKDRHRNGVGIIIAKGLVESVVAVTRKGDRIILVKLVIGGNIVNIISAYAPQVGLDDQTKRDFWEQMDEILQEIPVGENLVIGGDFNGHVGIDKVGYERVHGGYGFGDRNEAGERILDFALASDLVVANTMYKKRKEHLITFKSGLVKSQIDYFLVRKVDCLKCNDCKVIPGESLVSQHRILVLDLCFRGQYQARKDGGRRRTRWWDLKGDKLEILQNRMDKEGTWDLEGDANTKRNLMANCMRRISREVLGESKGTGPSSRETWWWREEVQAVVKAKKECFKKWQKDRTKKNLKSYRLANKEVKKVVRETKLKVYDDLYTRLDSKEGEKRVYKLAKIRERKTRDFNQVKCIKSEDSKVLVKDDEIKERWKNYFEKLLNEEHGSTTIREEIISNTINQDYRFFRRIRNFKVEIALKKMKSKKALGPDDIPIEAWKCLGKKGVAWLTRLFSKILLTRNMPDEWMKSILVPIYKNKGDVQNCNNYRGIKLMCHIMKVWERVMERRLRDITKVSENQFGFMPGRSTMEAIYLLRRVIEKYKEKKRDIHMVFIDLEKAYDRVP
ncbi:hypothetical protein CsSME_00002089 [Camellia sinensis var. sinensis]